MPLPKGPWAHGAQQKVEMSLPKAAGLVRWEVVGVPAESEGPKKIIGTTSWFHVDGATNHQSEGK